MSLTNQIDKGISFPQVDLSRRRSWVRVPSLPPLKQAQIIEIPQQTAYLTKLPSITLLYQKHPYFTLFYQKRCERGVNGTDQCDCDDCQEGDQPCAFDCHPDSPCQGCRDLALEREEQEYQIDEAQGRH